MSKELNRYTLVEYRGSTQRIFNSIEEYNEMLEKIKKHNKKANKKRYYGNIAKKIIDGKIYVTIHAYNKLTSKMPITKLDEFTSEFSEELLIELYKSKIETKEEYTPDINIAYFKEKDKKEKTESDPDIRIKYTPVLYKEDLKYLDKNYIFKYIKSKLEACDIDFFLDLADYFNPYKSKEVKEITGQLYDTIYNIKYNNLDIYSLYKITIKLFDALTIEVNKDGTYKKDSNGNKIINRKRLRDFGFFIKYYDKGSKLPKPTIYNKENDYDIDKKRKLKEEKEQLENLLKRIEKEENQKFEEVQYNRWDEEQNKRR